MKTSTIIAVALCLLSGGTLRAQMSLDEVVARNLDARGGLERLRQVESVRMTGKMALGPAGEIEFVSVWQRPDRFRIEFEIQGMKGIQVFDGDQAWQVMPFTGSSTPEPIDEDQRRQLEAQADFDGPFIDTAAKGYTLEYLGEEDVEEKPAHKIRVTDRHGEQTLVFLDGETFLQIRSEGKRRIRDQEVEFTTSQGDFRELDGLTLPYSIESRFRGAPTAQAITFTEIELGVEIDEGTFRVPEEEAATPEVPDGAADAAATPDE